MSVPNMTSNNLMVRFQQYWSFEEMQSTPSLPSLPCPLESGVEAPDMFLYMGQIKMFDI